MRTAIVAAAAAVAVIATLALHARAGEESKRPTAEEGFRAIQAVARGTDPDMLEVVIPSKLVDRILKDADVRTWREGFARRLAKATDPVVRENGDEAVARYASGKGDAWEVALHYTGTRWVVAAADAFQVKGRFLDAARGSSDAKAVLAARTEADEGYGKSAFSFAHVTGSPEQCKNRMNLWYDGNCGQIHSVGDGALAVVEAASPEAVDGIPVGPSWVRSLALEKGRVFVGHCARSGTADFFVACRIEACDDRKVEISWTLLAAGPGAPADIHRVQVLKSPDGADGAAGMCGRSGGGGKGGAGGSGGK